MVRSTLPSSPAVGSRPLNSRFDAWCLRRQEIPVEDGLFCLFPVRTFLFHFGQAPAIPRALFDHTVNPFSPETKSSGSSRRISLAHRQE